MLIILSGSSGSGKNTIINEIIKNKPHIKILKSCTSRTRRDEKENNYHYLSPALFKEKVEKGEFFEFEEVHKGIYYGVLKKSLKDAKSKDIYIKDIDVNGSMKLKKELGKHVKLVYLDVPKEILRERIIKRGETKESADLRLSRYDYERSFKDKYDLIIENKELDETVEIIIKELKL